MPASRRVFLMSAAAIGQAALLERGHAAAPVVDPSDPQANALGYTPDASMLPGPFAPRHADGAHCGNCALFQGKSAEGPGPCPLFGGKTVQGKGWCSSWVAKE